MVHNLGLQVLVDVAALQGLERQQLFGLAVMHQAHGAKGARAQGLQTGREVHTCVGEEGLVPCVGAVEMVCFSHVSPAWRAALAAPARHDVGPIAPAVWSWAVKARTDTGPCLLRGRRLSGREDSSLHRRVPGWCAESTVTHTRAYTYTPQRYTYTPQRSGSAAPCPQWHPPIAPPLKERPFAPVYA